MAPSGERESQRVVGVDAKRLIQQIESLAALLFF